MDEVMMVPVQEFKRLQNYYKGQMTENALLDKAGRLAAEEHLILNDKRIPDSMAVKMSKPLSSEQGRLVKRIRTGKTGPLTFRGTEEPEGMVDAPVERLLKEIIKKEYPAPVVVQPGPSGIKREKRTPKPGPSGIKKESKSTKPPIPPKPPSLKGTKTPTGKSGGWKKAALSGATKGLMKKIGIDPKFVDSFDTDDEGGYSPKKKGKGKYPKAKKTEAEKLQEGWEGWDSPTKGKLSYDTDDDTDYDDTI